MNDFIEEARVAKRGWVNLRTNPMPDLEGKLDESGMLVHPAIDQLGFEVNAVVSVYSQLAKLSRQRNCPFVSSVCRSNAVYLHVDPYSDISREGVGLSALTSVLSMVKKFFEISPRETQAGQSPDFTTLFWVFTTLVDPLDDPLGNESFSYARRFYAPIALASGLTLSDNGPEHPNPEGDGRNVMPFPTLIMHRLHREDRVFMQSPVAQGIFLRFFPERAAGE